MLWPRIPPFNETCRAEAIAVGESVRESPTRSERVPAIRTWTRLRHAHAAVTQQLGSQLLVAQGLSINDYETLAVLARAPGQRMRRVDLARWLLLTPSGVTRLLDGLTKAGFVERTGSEADHRVVYAQLTVGGAAKLAAATGEHVEAIHKLLENQLSPAELTQLGCLLGKLSRAA
jgi:DNA-binding MarR family transcriptional regulator